MANRVICPECRKELRTSAAVAAGTQFTCPACQAHFATGGAGAVSPAVAPRSRRSRRLIIGAIGAGLALLSVAAFGWPGFLRTGGLSSAALANQAQARNLLAFAPANSSVVAGIHIGHVRKQPELQNAWNKLRQQLTQFQNIPAEAHELIADADMVVLAYRGGLAGAPVCVVSTEHPFDAAKVKKAVNAGAARRHHGIAVYPCGNPIAGRAGYLALPTETIALLGFMPPEEFAQTVATAQQPRLDPDLQAQIDQISGSVIWCAVQFDDETKRGLRKLEEWAAPYADAIPEIKIIAPIVQRGKGAVVTVDLAEPQKVKLSIGFTCRDAADAAPLKTAVLNLWLNQGKALVGLVSLMGGNKLGKLLGEVSQTFDLEQRDSSVLLSVEVNQATLEELFSAVPLMNIPGFKALAK